MGRGVTPRPAHRTLLPYVIAILALCPGLVLSQPQRLSYNWALGAALPQLSLHRSGPVRQSEGKRDVMTSIQPLLSLLAVPEDIVRHAQQDAGLRTSLYRDALAAATARGAPTARRDVTRAVAANPIRQLEACIDDTATLLQALNTRQLWAMKMLDAFGKPGPDLMGLNFVWIGSYHECRDVTVTPAMTSTATRGFSGQYCNAYFPLQMSGVLNATVIEGICVPDSCGPSDIELLFNTYATLRLNNSVKVEQVTCGETPPSLDALTIAALSIAGALLLLVLLGTAVDVLHVQRDPWTGTDNVTFLLSGMETTAEEEKLPILHSGLFSSGGQQPGRCVTVLTSFSLISNTRKLLATGAGRDTLTCVHGVRFLSLVWVILGHSFWVPTILQSWNVTSWLQTSLQRFLFQIIANATLAVDSFFMISGLLVAYLALRELHKRQGAMNWPLFYLHRFWRLTPVYLLLILAYLTLWPYLGSGPAWPSAWSDRDNCFTSWWTNLLYVNNLVNVDSMCFGHSWYLANDMQFYILSPVIFVVFYYSAGFGFLVALLLLVASTVTPAVLTVVDKFPPGPLAMVDGMTADSQRNWSSDFYIKPYNRMAPYIVGLITGYILFRVNSRLRMPKVVVLLGWVLAAAMGGASLMGLYEATANTPMPLWEAALYNALGRLGWAVGLAWTIFACVTGNGGVVNTLLSWPALVPLSRMSYCAYLVHLPLLYVIFFLRNTAFYVTDLDVVMLFLGVLTLTYLLSAGVTVLVEMPLAGLEKALLHGGRHSPT